MLCTNSTTGRCLVINNVPSSLSFLLLITQSRVNVLWDKKQQQPQQEGSLDLFSVSLRDPALLLRALFPLSSFNLFIFRFCVKKKQERKKGEIILRLRFFDSWLRKFTHLYWRHLHWALALVFVYALFPFLFLLTRETLSPMLIGVSNSLYCRLQILNIVVDLSFKKWLKIPTFGMVSITLLRAGLKSAY